MRTAVLLAWVAGSAVADGPARLAEGCGGFRADVVLSDAGASLEATELAAEVLSDRLPGPRVLGQSLTSEVEVTGPGRLTIWRAGAADFGLAPEVLFASGGPMAVYDVVAFGRPPSGGEFVLPGQDGVDVVMRDPPVIAALGVARSEASFDQNNRPAVAITLTADSARAFGEATAERVGQPLALVHDGVVLTAPTILSAIYGGSLVITGSFSVEDAEFLAAQISGGALAHDVEVEMTVVLTGTGDAECSAIVSGAGDAAD